MARFLVRQKSLVSWCGKSILSPASSQFCQFLSLEELSGGSSSSCSIGDRRNSHCPPESVAECKSFFESNVIRRLRAEIEYQLEFAPPRQPPAEFNGFTVQDRPAERWVTFKRKLRGDENIKIEATMFDGGVVVPGSEDLRLHISLLVDIWKGEGNDLLEFVCSAWPESMEIEKVYIFRRDKSHMKPYMGPNIKNLKNDLRDGLYEYLDSRGVNNDLAVFVHEYIMNKERMEHIKWLDRVQSFVES